MKRKYLEVFQVSTWAIILVFLGLWKGLVFLGTLIGLQKVTTQLTFSSYREPMAYHLPRVWAVMSNFDGQHYLAIAAHGYQQFTEAFFPFYPLLIFTTAKLLHLPFIIAALIISHFSFVFALYVVWKLLELDVPKFSSDSLRIFQLLCVTVIISFPTAQFYGATYNDSLFFFLATSSLFLGRSQKWFAASLCGGLATLTRLNGLALWPFLFFEFLSVQTATEKYFWQPAWWLRNWRSLLKEMVSWKFLVMLLIPGAFLAYLFFHQVFSGSWYVVLGNMQIWQQDKVTLPPQVVWRYLKILILTSPNTYQYWVAFLELFSVSFYVSCLIYAWRKIRFSYWVFIFTSILIPWLTGSFQGMPRYGLHLYPLFLIIALFLKHSSQWIKVIYFLTSIGLFLFYTIFFISGYFVA
jgi:hypothetical protein